MVPYSSMRAVLKQELSKLVLDVADRKLFADKIEFNKNIYREFIDRHIRSKLKRLRKIILAK